MGLFGSLFVAILLCQAYKTSATMRTTTMPPLPPSGTPGYNLTFSTTTTVNHTVDNSWLTFNTTELPSSCSQSLNASTGSFRYSVFMGEQCSWEILVPQGMVVTINLHMYYMNSYSSIQIYDGPQNQVANVPANVQLYNYVSFTQSVRVVVNNNYSSLYLNGYFYATPADSSCGGILDVDSNQLILSPNYPNNYPNNLKCAWIFKGPNSRFSFSIMDFRMQADNSSQEQSEGECPGNSLTVYSGENKNSVILDTLCSTNPPRQGLESSGSMTVVFRSDESNSSGAFAFMVSKSWNTDICGGVFNGTEGVLSRNNSFYSSTCHWLIETSPEKAVFLKGTFCRNVEIHEGQSLKGPVLVQSSSFTCQNLTLLSSGNIVSLVTYGEFQLTYMAAEPSTSFSCDFEQGFCGWRNIYGNAVQWSQIEYNQINIFPLTSLISRSRAFLGIIHIFSDSTSTLLGPLMTNAQGPKCLSFWFTVIANNASLALYVTNTDSMQRSLLWEASPLSGINARWGTALVNINYTNYQVEFVADVQMPGVPLIGIDDITMSDGECPEAPSPCYTLISTSEGSLEMPQVSESDNDFCLWAFNRSSNEKYSLFLELSGQPEQNSTEVCSSSNVVGAVMAKQIYNYQFNIQNYFCHIGSISMTTQGLSVIAIYLPGLHKKNATFSATFEAHTCRRVLNETSGVITSPNYPNEYNNFDDCAWLIHSSENTKIRLSFTEFRLEQSYDYVTVYDGPSADFPQLGRFTGFNEPQALTSSGSHLYVTFTSDGSVVYTGFRAYFESIDGCSLSLEGDSGSVNSFYDLTSSTNMLCTVDITVPNGFFVKLLFRYLNLPASELCENSSLSVYDGPAQRGNSLGRFCGQTQPPSVRSLSNNITLVFKVSGNFMQEYGFNLEFYKVDPLPASRACGWIPVMESHINSRIVGGNETILGKWPWQASLRNYNEFTCGGSLLNDRWIVSAAHCFESNYPFSWMVYLGLNSHSDLSASTVVARNVSRIIIHERYNRSSNDYDIALMELSQSVSFTDYIQPVCLPPRFQKFPYPGKSCFISGWGTLFEGGYIRDQLQEASIEIFKTCITSGPLAYDPSKISNRMLCAGYLQGGVDTCQGDLGGPLVCQDSNSRWFLSGITSWGEGCAWANQPGVYTRVTKVIDWIHQNMQ